MTAQSNGNDAKRPPRKPIVPVADKLRLTLGEAASLVNISENTIVSMLRRGEFPGRVQVPGCEKELFIAREVRAWADGLDWRALVAERTPQEQEK